MYFLCSLNQNYIPSIVSGQIRYATLSGTKNNSLVQIIKSHPVHSLNLFGDCGYLYYAAAPLCQLPTAGEITADYK